ncbi:hypothetical protein KJK34_00300 [Flavobacterium sp. D11R37]|uniref:hypothetical protein n=1 Tax=Flavobacterium coralii TaxID=2838017 RepID=UPI001CA79648|nr:hypothetical protein [Flavobacterium coralii]MBY8961183.1 hypothetical protein [Flavobacterium coralii]
MFKNNNKSTLYNDFDFESFFYWFKDLSDDLKVYYISKTKFTSIDYFEEIDKKYCQGFNRVFFGMFSTGNHGSRRNLKDSKDNSKRDNPKRISEGEEQENYFLLCFNSPGNVELILQNAGRGVTSINIKNYFDKFFNRFLSEHGYDKEFILKEGTIVETTDIMIDRLDRITKTKIFIDKSILSDELDISDRTVQAKADLIIDVRARRGQDIREFLEDLRQKVVYKSKIDKVWIEGKDNNGNSSNFFIDQVQKSVFIDVEIDLNTAAIVMPEVKKALLNLI